MTRSAQARTCFRHVENYLSGCCNEPALAAWRLAVAEAFREGRTLDEAIEVFALAYLKHIERLDLVALVKESRRENA